MRALAALLCTVLALSGCSALGSLRGSGPPLTAGTGSDSYQLQVQLADATNLVPYAEVKLRDVTVGTVTAITMVDWHAQLTISLPAEIRLPADTRAQLGQKSLLGALYLELRPPPRPDPAAAELAAGQTIPLSRTGAYPATEDLLIALSTVLNGSGLQRIRTISTELNRALDGNTDEVRGVLTKLRVAARELAKQRKDIGVLLDRLAALSVVLERDAPRMDRNLAELAPGIQALEQQRPALLEAMAAIDTLDRVATPLLSQTQRDLSTELRQLRPVLAGLTDAGDDLPSSLRLAGTVLFPLATVPRTTAGDYANLFLRLDLRVETVLRSLTDGVPPVRTAATTADLFTATRGGS